MEDKSFKYWLAIAALILSLIAYAFVPLLIRWCEGEISPAATVFNRFAIATLMLICGQGGQNLYQQWFSPKPRDPLDTALPHVAGEMPQPLERQLSDSEQVLDTILTQQSGSIIVPINWQLLLLWMLTVTASIGGAIVWAESLEQTSVANSSLMHNLAPLFTTLASWLFFQTQFEIQFILGTIIAVIGTIALGINDFQLDIHRIKGDALALLSALFFAVHLLGVERLRSQFSSRVIMQWEGIVGTVLAMVITLGLGQDLFPLSLQGWSSVIGLAIVGHLIGLGLLIYSLNYLSASLVALVFLLDPVLTTFTAWVAFSETLDLWNMMAFCIILLGIYLGITAKQSQTTANGVL